MTTAMSGQGLALLIEREGKRNQAYRDSKGIWTIGVGHTGPDVHEGLVWLDQQVAEALRRDLAWAEAAVNNGVHGALEQFEFDALVSFIFNIGAGQWASSTLLRLINEGDMDGAAAQFDRWHIPAEIASRRNGEREQFKGTRFEARIEEAMA